MKRLISKIVSFIDRDLWFDRDHTPLSATIMRQIKLFIISGKNAELHKIKISSGALTFFTLTSLVPVVALILALSKGFGIEDRVIGHIKSILSFDTSMVDYVTTFANTYLENSRVGLFAGVGFLVLVWSVVMVFSNIERAFNTTWGIKRQRSLVRKFTDYIAVVISLPILFFIYSSFNSFVSEQVVKEFSSLPFVNSLIDIILYVINAIVLFMIFTFAYCMFPNTRVKFSAAFYASVVTGAIYLLFSAGYTYAQSKITSYSVVYGGFAALPLFLIWMNISWMIILFGAELSFAYQNLSRYESMMRGNDVSPLYRRKLSIVVAAIILQDFIKHNPAPTASQIANRLKLSVSHVEDALFELEVAKIIKGVDPDEDRDYQYMPTYDQSQMSVVELNSYIDKSTSSGETLDSFNEDIDRVFDGLYVSLSDSVANIKVKDIDFSSLDVKENV